MGVVKGDTRSLDYGSRNLVVLANLQAQHVVIAEG